MDNRFEKPKKGNLIRKIALAGALATAATVGVVEKYGNEIGDQIEKITPVEKFESHKGFCVIFKKIYTPGKSEKDFPLGPPGISRLMHNDTKDAWFIQVKVNGSNMEIRAQVSKQQFDSFTEGKEYSIVYKTLTAHQGIWIDSISGEKVGF